MFKMKIFRQVGWSRALGLLLLVWLIFLLMAFALLRHESNDPQTSQRLSQAFKELQLLHQQRTEINQLINVFHNGYVLQSVVLYFMFKKVYIYNFSIHRLLNHGYLLLTKMTIRPM